MKTKLAPFLFGLVAASPAGRVALATPAAEAATSGDESAGRYLQVSGLRVIHQSQTNEETAMGGPTRSTPSAGAAFIVAAHELAFRAEFARIALAGTIEEGGGLLHGAYRLNDVFELGALLGGYRTFTATALEAMPGRVEETTTLHLLMGPYAMARFKLGSGLALEATAAFAVRTGSKDVDNKDPATGASTKTTETRSGYLLSTGVSLVVPLFGPLEYAPSVDFVHHTNKVTTEHGGHRESLNAYTDLAITALSLRFRL